jgi:two-component sensor histidine kinase
MTKQKKKQDLMAEELITLRRQVTDMEQSELAHRWAEDTLREKILLNQTLLDAFPCVALLLRPQTREIIVSNAVAVKIGAVPGTRCFSTWGQRQDPCPWCLAPALWATGGAQHLEVEALGIFWDAYWIPVAEDIYMHFAFDITARKRAEEALQASLAEKEVLLREVHHRVKNSLAAVIGLLALQRQAIDNSTVTAVLEDLSSRIKAMALVHERLYRSENLSRIAIQDYLKALISHLRTSFGSRGNIRCTIAADGIEMDLDTAVPCGMIVNELITNSLKHGFPGDKPRPGASHCELTVSMEWDGTTYTLVVADNGVGVPADLDWVATKSLGLRLVRMLGQHQLRGHIELDRTNGTRFTLTFGSRHRR